MKKVLLTLCSLCMGMVLLQSCCKGDEGNPPVNPGGTWESRNMTIENATYQEGAFPTTTDGSSISGLSINPRALPGGMNIITIVTKKKYKKFYVGLKDDSAGYLVYTPEETSTGDYYTYTIPVMYSPTYGKNEMTMLISAEDEDGNITEPYEAEISFVDSESGELNINLTFSNAKDIDLHLIMPSGEQIYYGARGGSVQTTDGKVITYGLDHDSNAGCSIDNLNNENIYIPAELIQSGTYRVIVNMYSNCDANISTSWSVVTRYKGQLISTTAGKNPATGVYAVGAERGDFTTAMEFTINDAGTRAGANIKAGSFIPTPQNDMDIMKMEEEKFFMEINK